MLIVNLYFIVYCFLFRFSALFCRKLPLRGCPKNKCCQSVANFFLEHSWRVSCIFSKLTRWRTVLAMNTFTETLQEFCVDVRQSCTVFLLFAYDSSTRVLCSDLRNLILHSWCNHWKTWIDSPNPLMNDIPPN